MQVLYQWQLTGQGSDELLAQYLGSEELKGADPEYFTELVRECSGQRDQLDELLGAHIDRPVVQLDPVEHAILLLGAYELARRPDIPYRVCINEAVELSKRFGATDGHRYVNAVLDKLAGQIRAEERK